MYVRFLAVGLLFTRAALAQSTVQRETPLLVSPGGRSVASVVRGAAIRAGAARGASVAVSVEGWISTGLLGPARDSFDVTVTKPGARLRAAPSSGAAVVATLQRGMGLHVIQRAAGWTRVRRAGWVARAALSAPAPPRERVAAATPARGSRPAAELRPKAVPTPAPDSSAAAPSPDALTPARAVRLGSAPGGKPLGVVEPGAVLQPLARDRGWVRVRLEGWLPERDLVAADSSVTSPSAADVRADPKGARGRLVRWDVEILAFRRADAMRPDLHPDEPYLLARGPGDENALLYLAVPAALLEVARGLPPTSRAVVTARVRDGKSEPTGVPVLDLLTLARP